MLPETIKNECSEYLINSNNIPLYKKLPSIGEGFRKIKVRKRNKYEIDIEKYFDIAFNDLHKDLRLRSVVSSTIKSKMINDGEEWFFIFPTNGYTIITNNNLDDYYDYIKLLQSKLDGMNQQESLLIDLFKSSFETTKTTMNTTDVVIYGIKYYYAIRCSLIDDYANFVTS